MWKKKSKKGMKKKNGPSSIDRILFVGVIGLAIATALVLRLCYITIVKGKEYTELANAGWQSEVSLAAKRGDILDRNGAVLVTSVTVYRIEADLDALRTTIEEDNITMNEVAKNVAKILTDVDESELLKKLDDKDSTYALITTGVEKSVADKISALDYYGLVISSETERIYPNGAFLAQVLGLTSSDGTGLTGLELQYDDYLTGISGMEIGGVDSDSNSLPYVNSTVTPSIDGEDIVTTIDENLQYYAEAIAQLGYTQNEAKRVSITIMNPNNGEILAMASKPDYDPNNPNEGYESFEGDDENEQIQNMWRNSIVSDSYEPGSTFKIITMMAALEEGLINDTTTYECDGSLEVDGVTIHCWDHAGHGEQTAEEILQNSCNVGFMLLGQQLGAEKLNEYIEKLGFGSLTNVDLPGEASGIIKATESISNVDLATIAFGQTDTVTAMQLMRAINAVANGGTLIQPHVVKEISHEDANGNRIVDETIEAETTENVLSEESCEKLRDFLMKYSLEDDSSDKTIQSFVIAGKTGTGQKVDIETGSYSTDKYLASIVAMAPADDPQITMYITVDEPSTGIYYGGQVATPLMKSLFSSIVEYMESSTAKGSYSIVKNIIVPEVRGLSIEDAKSILKENGLSYKVEGSGDIVTSTDPYPGTTVKDGATVTLYAESKSKVGTEIIMPDLTGKTLESAKNVLENLGISCEYQGSGKVYSQSIENGELISSGTKVILTLKEDSEY